MSFTFVQVTDLHLSLGSPAYGAGQGDATYWFADGALHDRIVTTPAVLSALFEEIAALTPDFVVATGDLTNTGSDAELAAYAEVVANAPVRVVSIPGNHDHDNKMTPSRSYEMAIGPRWFSFDHDGVHFAAIDWFTWRTRHDNVEQEAWLTADLAALPSGTPVVLLTHDQMDSAFYDRLPVRPVATFSGHWHTTRVVEAAGTVHYNTGTATFGGLDYSPAHYRVATWNGQRLDVRTITRRAIKGRKARGGALSDETMRAHLSGPVVAGDSVLTVSREEDRPGGALRCGAVADLAPRWSVELASAVKTEPLVVDSAAIAVAVTGETVCVDLATGAERWRTQLGDPLHHWVHLRPATDGSRVFVGDVGCFVALDLATGEEVWRREDLGERENLTSFSHPVVVGGRLLVAFVAQIPALWALDPATGATLWPAVDRGRCLYREPEADLPQHLPRVVVSAITADPDADDVYVVRLGARLERLRASTGALVWAADFSGWFNPAAPVVWGDQVLATEGSGRLFSFDRMSGSLRWVTAVGGPAPLAMGSYRADGPVALAPPTLTRDNAIIPTGDGHLLALDRRGVVVGDLDIGVPVTGRLAVAGDQVLAVGIDGVLRSFDLYALT